MNSLFQLFSAVRRLLTSTDQSELRRLAITPQTPLERPFHENRELELLARIQVPNNEVGIVLQNTTREDRISPEELFTS